MLNDAKVRAAKPQPKPYKLTDSHRLFLLVNPSGSKLWRWSYAFDGKQKSMAFGIYPMVSLVSARAKRDEARAVLEEGRDPSIAKKLRIEANIEASRNTFERLAREWHDPAEKLGAALKPLRRGRQPAITDLTRLRKMIDDAEQDYARPITRLALRLLALTAGRGEDRAFRVHF